MELVLPYLEAESFKHGLTKDYRFEETEFLNDTFLEMPQDLGSGNPKSTGNMILATIGK